MLVRKRTQPPKIFRRCATTNLTIVVVSVTDVMTAGGNDAGPCSCVHVVSWLACSRSGRPLLARCPCLGSFIAGNDPTDLFPEPSVSLIEERESHQIVERFASELRTDGNSGGWCVSSRMWISTCARVGRSPLLYFSALCP